jgi:hypothetical protein
VVFVIVMRRAALPPTSTSPNEASRGKSVAGAEDEPPHARRVSSPASGGSTAIRDRILRIRFVSFHPLDIAWFPPGLATVTADPGCDARQSTTRGSREKSATGAQIAEMIQDFGE